MIKSCSIVCLCLSVTFFCAAQYTDSASLRRLDNEKSRMGWRYTGYAIPAGMLAYGLLGLDEDGGVKQLNLSTRSELKEDLPGFNSRLDNFFQFSPYVATFILQTSGVKGIRSYKDQTIVTLISTSIMALTVSSLKKVTHSERPDGSTYNSFPSGHTATAFTGAELMRQQFLNQPVIIRYSGFALASVTGGMRVYNNRHWVSDVVAGAAIGILSAKAGDWIFSRIQKRSCRRLSTRL